MISIAVCDDNEITAQEISEKVKQCCPIEAEVSVFYHIKDILFSIHNENKLFDIIFMDPPYHLDLEERIVPYLLQSSLVKAGSLIIVETALDTDVDYMYELGCEVERIKEYKTNRHVFLRVPGETEA